MSKYTSKKVTLIIIAAVLAASTAYAADYQYPPASAVVNVKIEQGSTWEMQPTWQQCQDSPQPTDPDDCVTWAAVNITGYTVKASVKANPANSAVLANISTALVTPASGVFKIFLNAGKTRALGGTNAYYDVLMQAPSGSISYLLSGTFVVTRTVTTP